MQMKRIRLEELPRPAAARPLLRRRADLQPMKNTASGAQQGGQQQPVLQCHLQQLRGMQKLFERLQAGSQHLAAKSEACSRLQAMLELL